MFKHFPFIHNHGDFVHLDAMRDWLRGVVSLETFLKSKDDKAIVKDMHFTDERTTVNYIDTKDDTEKTETLCEYLTSDVFDETNPTQFNKVDKISFIKNENGERRINVREKNNKKQRLSVILSNIPIAYDANTNTYNGTSKSHHIGVNENGVKIYNDETLQVIREYQFKDTVKTVGFSDFSPIKRCYNETTNVNFAISNSKLELYALGNQPLSGQAICSLSESITLNAGKYVSIGFELNDVIPENQPVLSNFINPVTSKGLYAKKVRCSTENMQNVDNNVVHILSSVFSGGSFPVSNGNVLVTFYNPSENNVKINDFVITF